MPQKNWLEWTVFSLSMLLVVGILGYLSYDAITTADAAAELVLETGAPISQTGGYAVPVTVTNNGDQTAEGVTIAVSLLRNGSDIEQGEFQAAYVPRHSSVEGWVIFHTDPATAHLEARILGYQQP